MKQKSLVGALGATPISNAEYKLLQITLIIAPTRSLSGEGPSYFFLRVIWACYFLIQLLLQPDP